MAASWKLPGNNLRVKQTVLREVIADREYDVTQSRGRAIHSTKTLEKKNNQINA